jgi:signal transduction histidine kinase
LRKRAPRRAKAKSRSAAGKSRGTKANKTFLRPKKRVRRRQKAGAAMQRGRSATAAERSQTILSKTLESMADAVVVMDSKGRIVLTNPAAMQLFEGAATLGDLTKGYRLHQADGSTPIAEGEGPLSRALRGLPTDTLELVRRPDDARTARHLIASARPIFADAGQVEGAVAVYHEITALRATERQLRQAQKMEAIGQLTGGIAHDFNNLLTVIIGMNGILAEAVAHDPALRETAAMIDEAADRGAQMINNLLAFARRQPLQPRAIDLADMVRSATKLLSSSLGEQIEIRSSTEEGLWPAMVDPGQLTNAILNLALNARDAMRDAGKLTIEAGNVVLDDAYAQMHGEVQPGDYVMIAVSDTGSGIPAADLERIFEPFFSTKKKDGGTGLGLSMVYGFVKQSGGHIKVYSEPGQGTTMRLYLPRAPGSAMTSHSIATPDGDTGTERILLVEDDALVRGSAVAQLRSLGYRVTAAATGPEALAVLDSGAEFDLLFTDVILPGGMNGSQLAGEVARRRPAMKILYTSGYTENAIVHHGRLDAGVRLLAKPYRKVQLARSVREALGAP